MHISLAQLVVIVEHISIEVDVYSKKRLHVTYIHTLRGA